jgi:hypothetical protein
MSVKPSPTKELNHYTEALLMNSKCATSEEIKFLKDIISKNIIGSFRVYHSGINIPFSVTKLKAAWEKKIR